MEKQFILHNEAETIAFGNEISELLQPDFVIYLQGDLGAGKTTLSRGILRGLGVTERVKSPTYSLVEPYECEQFDVYHFDCYRLLSPDALHDLGLSDYFNSTSVCLVEWPEKGEGVLPAADIIISLQMHERGREILLQGKSQRGHTLVGCL